MILPDVNILVYAYRREAEHHDEYASWLSALVAGSDELALVDLVLVGFVRIVTNPRIMRDPAPTREALGFVDRLVGARRARWIGGNPTTWTTLSELVDGDHQVRGNLVPHGYLAALAIAHGCLLGTNDRGFARFDGLDTVHPLAA